MNVEEDRIGIVFTFTTMLELAREEGIEEKDMRSHRAIRSIVFSVIALESFLNDLEATAEVLSNDRPSGKYARALRDLLQGLENERVPLREKFQSLMTFLASRSFNKGENPYQEFNLLMNLRNEIVHAKAAKVSIDKGNPLDARPFSLVVALAERGLCIRPERFPTQSWSSYFRDDQRVAIWAHDTAVSMIISIYDNIPYNTLLKSVLVSRMEKIGCMQS